MVDGKEISFNFSSNQKYFIKRLRVTHKDF